MTIEEIDREIQKLDEDFKNLSAPGKTLTKEESRRKSLIGLKKSTLEKIKEAKAKNQPDRELKLNMDYSVLCTHGHRHPFLLYLIHARVRGNMTFGI